jgi:hypothetical protein
VEDFGSLDSGAGFWSFLLANTWRSGCLELARRKDLQGKPTEDFIKHPEEKYGKRTKYLK